MAATATFTWEEIRKHNSLKNGLWLVIHGSVYDVTHFALEHPGGVEPFLEHTGKEAGGDFDDIGHSNSAKGLMGPLMIGKLAN